MVKTRKAAKCAVTNVGTTAASSTRSAEEPTSSRRPQSHHSHSHHASTKSSATVVAQQLKVKARHLRRLADIETERERSKAERESAIAELELQAELAAIEATPSGSRASVCSRRSVQHWLELQSFYSNEHNVNTQLSPQVCVETPVRATEAADTSTPLLLAPSHPSVSSPAAAAGHTATTGVVADRAVERQSIDFISTHNQRLHSVGTRAAAQSYYECNTNNKTLVGGQVHTQNTDLRLLAEVIADLAKDRPRRVSDIKLPFFDGRATDWLAFRRIFDDTKAAFTPTENLARLNSAIRGVARDAVSTLLVSAQEPEEVLSALELRFARPEYIVLQEIALVRALPKLPLENGKELNLFACRVRNCIETIKLLNQIEYLASPELSNAILSKLTPLLRTRWADYASSRVSTKFKLELLADFLAHESDLQIKFGLIPDSIIHHDSSRRDIKGKNIYDKIHTVSTASDTYNSFTTSFDDSRKSTIQRSNEKEFSFCRYCQNNEHDIGACKKFQSLSVDVRWRWVKENKVCYKCFKRGGHSYKNCKKNFCELVNCKYKRGHHTLLHKPSEVLAHIDVEPQPICSTSEASDILVAHNSSGHSGLRPLLKIIPVTVSGPKGSVDTFALLDDGSTATLVDSKIALAIDAEGPKSSIRLDCIGGLSKQSEVNLVDLKIKGHHSSETYLMKNVRSIPNLGTIRQSIKANDVRQCSHLADLVDVLCYDDAKPMLIIGADYWYLTISRATRQGTLSQPVATLTSLGWVLYGFSSSKTIPVKFINHATVSDIPNDVDSLETLLKECYKLDSIGISKKDYHSSNDEHALKILKESSRRLPSSRFETGLLWRPDIKNIPNSRNLALSRFLNLEKKLQRDESYADSYKNNIKTMLEKDYAELCSDSSSSLGIRWYLPHFGVIHPQKRKLRIVFDAAASSQGISLNSLLLPGPDLLQPLLAILMRFREGRVALNADIREMFPQVKIREQDRDAQRFLWRDNPSQPIKEYRMSSMIFGATSSPCTALFLKNLNAEEHRLQFPAAVEAIISNHYMDDFLGSFDTVEEAAQIAADIVVVHSRACFEMRAWVSNCNEALSLLPPDMRAVNVSEVGLINSPKNVRILGVSWNTVGDRLCFIRSLPENSYSKLTKRIILSHLMRIYDPLGLLTPIVIQGRILFQQIWRLGIDWDGQLPSNVISRWTNWCNELREIVKESIPRCYLDEDDPIERQLHVFADASEHAYSCVAYWRFSFKNGRVTLALIGGKARLAPLKPVSIPRLELQAALIAARFGNYIIDAHKHKPSKVTFWSDSLTVIKWLRSDARSFKSFVAHRVGEIVEVTDSKSWRYVPTSLNVADDATRPQTKFKITSRWFMGPSFLLSEPKAWPQEPSANIPLPLEELKQVRETVGLIVNQPHQSPLPVVADHTRFSVWLRLVRATARALQGAHKFRSLLRNSVPNSKISKKKEDRRNFLPSLSAEDISNAEQQLLLRSQLDSFNEEIVCLRKSAALPKGSRLRNLTIVLDTDNKLKLSSRVAAIKNLPSCQDIHPIVLDGRHNIVRLLISHFHRKFAHGNNELIVNELRQKYHILHLRPSVKSVAKQCQYCRLRKAVPQIPPFGDLPEGRLAHHVRPFTHVGLDYFGPINVTAGRRKVKRYVALFTCLTIRAVHLEIVETLTTDSAVMALRRFIARRGCPSNIYSDNGTAFVGASRQLSQMFDFTVNNKIKWTFIPPAAPFMGGCWERLVRSIKTALSITLKGREPKEEILYTLLLEAEAIVNSRPLTHVSVDPEEEEALTPFHFILGTSSNEPPLVPLVDADLYRRLDWRKGLRMADHFWQRWTKEVLPCLIPRPSTSKPYSNIKCGDFVLVVDGSLPRACWPRGRVVKTCLVKMA